MASNYSFPELSPAEICKVLHEEQIAAVGPPDIGKPTADLLFSIISNFFLYLDPLRNESEAQIGFEALTVLENPEDHAQAIQVLNVYNKIKAFFASIEYNSFTLRDLLRPDPKRTIQHLSCLVNFIYYRNDKLLELKPVMDEFPNYEERRSQLNSKIAELKTAISNHEMEARMDEPMVKQVESEEWRAVRRSLHLSDYPKSHPKVGSYRLNREYSSHSVADYHEISRFSWRENRIVQFQIVNALRVGDRENASKLLSNISHVNHSLNAEDFSCILEYCAEAPDPLFVMETWKTMEEKEIDLNKSNCRSIIRALSKGGYTKEALDWLSLLEENDYKNNMLSIFNVFLNISSKTKNLKEIDTCLEKMESQFIGKSEITYCELLKVAVLQKNLVMIHEIWKDCNKYYSPSIITLRKFIWSFAKLGDLDSAYNILQHMLNSCTGTEIRVSSKKRYQTSRLDIPVPALVDLPDFKLPIYNMEFENKQGLCEKYTLENNLLRWAFNNLIHSSARFRNFDLTEKLFIQMQEIGLYASKYTYDGLIKALITKKGVKHAENLIGDMEKKEMKPYNNTLAKISLAYSKNLKLNLAEFYLDKISNDFPKLIHPFNALLSACNTLNEPDKAVQILSKIKKWDNIKFNIRTYELLFSLFGCVNVPYEEGNILSHVDVSRRIDIIETHMSNNEIRHSFTSLRNLIRALGKEGMVEEMLKYLNKAESMLWNLDPLQKSELYNIALSSLVKADQIQAAIRIFKSMRMYGLPGNVAIYNIMIECCRKFNSFQSAFSLLSLMYKDGFLPQTFTYTAFLKVLLSNEDFGSAIGLLDMSRIEKIQPDIELYNTIFREAYIKGRIDVIEHVLEQLHRDKIQPDPTTLWFAFSAYADAELHGTAMEALQVLSMRMISLESSLLEQKRPVFEEILYSEEPDAEAKIFEKFDKYDVYLSTALVNLRWCAILGFDLCWSPNESFWAERVASSYESRRAKSS